MRFDLTGRTVLVVGGAGYVGSVLVERLLATGARVRVLDQLIYDNGFALQHLLDHERLTFRRGDLRDAATFADAAAGVDDVVLLAALVGDPVCKRYPELAEQVNHHGAVRIVDALDELGIARFVFTSTCSNYGIHDSADLATETSALNPQSRYARTKIQVEEHVLASAQRSTATSTVLRIATAYGMSPRMRFDLTVSQFAHELATAGDLLVYDADTWRPYCHVRDIAKAVMTVLTASRSAVSGEVFNVGANDQQFTKRMLVEQMQRHLDDARIEYRDGDTDPRNYRVSFDKITQRLGFRPDHRVQDYVGAVVAAARAGVYPTVVDGDSRFGNYGVDHLKVLTDETAGR